jgi:hypothetical protein
MYVLCEIDYEDSWYNLIMASTDLLLLQDICLALYQEQDYEGWFDAVHYYGAEPKYVEPLRPADCCYFIKEVPLVGCEIVSKAEDSV